MLIGKYTYYGNMPQTHWGNEKATLVIGSFCSIASNLQVYLGGNHMTNWVTTYPFGHKNTDKFNKFIADGKIVTNGDVIIGNDVWIGDDVTIMSGVTIGDGAVIAKNSHVVKNVDPYSIVGCNPSKLIKYMFSPDQIEQLLNIKWWCWDEEKINKYTPLLCNDNIDEFIKSAIDI